MAPIRELQEANSITGWREGRRGSHHGRKNQHLDISHDRGHWSSTDDPGSIKLSHLLYLSSLFFLLSGLLTLAPEGPK